MLEEGGLFQAETQHMQNAEIRHSVRVLTMHWTRVRDRSTCSQVTVGGGRGLGEADSSAEMPETT